MILFQVGWFLYEFNKDERVKVIDRVRGFAVFYMIWFQFIGRFDNLPILPRLGIHAPDVSGVYFLPNFTCADIIAPLFF